MTESEHATTRLTVDANAPDPEAIERAATMVRGGGLVAFPTETVYGLGANALDASAVARIFEAKGRPSNNPIIVHVADIDGARPLVREWPPTAQALAERFWPGPLTLVLPRGDVVPDIVAAGGPTVGIRVPSNAVALALIRALGAPIAAPSANRSERLSPTTADHVQHDLAGRIDAILDGGPCSGGLESTVLDLTTKPPRILRPGLVAPASIASVIGEVDGPTGAPPDALRSPGMLPRHYAPRARVLVRADDAQAWPAGANAGWLRLGKHLGEAPHTIDMPVDPDAYAARLYAALHELDDAGVAVIVVDLPADADQSEAWLAIRDRLKRATKPHAAPEAAQDLTWARTSYRLLGTFLNWTVEFDGLSEPLRVSRTFARGTPFIDGVFRSSRLLGSIQITDEHDQPLGRVVPAQATFATPGVRIYEPHGDEVGRYAKRTAAFLPALVGLFLRVRPVWVFDLFVGDQRAGWLTLGQRGLLAPTISGRLSIDRAIAPWLDGRLALAALTILAHRHADRGGMPTHPVTSRSRHDALLEGGPAAAPVHANT